VAFGLAVEPVQSVADFLTQQCNVAGGQKQLPTQLSAGSTTISFFTEEDLAAHTTNGRFRYLIPFKVSSMDYLDVSFTYNSLASLFSLSVADGYMNEVNSTLTCNPDTHHTGAQCDHCSSGYELDRNDKCGQSEE